jgi:hypothetical protein
MVELNSPPHREGRFPTAAMEHETLRIGDDEVSPSAAAETEPTIVTFGRFVDGDERPPTSSR